MKKDPLGNPVDQRHPWNQTTTPRPQKRDPRAGRQVHVGDVAALARSRGRRRCWRSTPAAGRSRGSGSTALAGLVEYRRRQGDRTQRQDHAAAHGESARRSSSSGRSRSGRTPSSGTVPAPTSRRTRRRWRSTSSNRPARSCFAGRTRDGDRVQGPRRGDRLRLPRGGARRAVASRRHPRRQDRELPSVSADLLERQPARLRRRRPVRTRTRCRTRRSSRRTAPTTSRASTSCAPSAASIRVCRAASTCISAMAARSRPAHADVRDPERAGSVSDGVSLAPRLCGGRGPGVRGTANPQWDSSTARDAGPPHPNPLPPQSRGRGGRILGSPNGIQGTMMSDPDVGLTSYLEGKAVLERLAHGHHGAKAATPQVVGGGSRGAGRAGGGRRLAGGGVSRSRRDVAGRAGRHRRRRDDRARQSPARSRCSAMREPSCSVGRSRC